MNEATCLSGSTSLTDATWLRERLDGVFMPESTVERSFKGQTSLFYVVSESIQNAQDGSGTDENGNRRTCNVKFTLMSVPRRALERAGYEEAVRHAELSGYDVTGADDEMIRCLLIEDQGTGLTAETYYNFARRSGVSGKGGNDGGRHGMGRLSMIPPSRARVMYGLSVCEQTQECIFIGVSICRVVRTEEGYLASEGVFLRDDRDAGFPPPKGEEALALGQAIGMPRTAEQHGLSILIPAIKDHTYQANMIAKEVINQKFAAIAMGKLEVTVQDLEANQTFTLNKDNLTHEAERVFSSVYSLSQRSHLSDDLPSIVRAIQALQDTSNHAYVAGLHDIEAELLQELQERYSDSRPVVLGYPVEVEHKDRGKSFGDHVVCCLRKEGLKANWEIQIRDGIMKVRSRSGSSNVKHILISLAQDDDFAYMLGDSEDPSHENWRDRFAEDRGWIHPKPAIALFYNSARELPSLLQTEQNKADFSTLSRLFPTPTSNASKNKSAATGGGREVQQVPEISVSRLAQHMLIVQSDAGGKGRTPGFMLKLNSEGREFIERNGELPRIIMRAAFSDVHSKSVKRTNYASSDYDFSEFDLHYQGAEKVESYANVIEIQGMTPDFMMKMSGDFDCRRDLWFTLESDQ